MLIADAFEILSGANQRIADLGVLIVDKKNTPLEPKYTKELLELTSLYNVIFELVVFNDNGTEVLGAFGQNDTAINSLLLQLKKLAKIFTFPEIPSPVTSYLTTFRSINNNLPLGTQGDLLYHDGADWTAFAKGSDGDVLVSTPLGLQWQSVVGNGLPSGGGTGQMLVKASGTSYDAIWATPALSMMGVMATANEVNQLIGVTDNVQGQINTLASMIGGGLNNSLQEGYFWIGDINDQAAAMPPSGDVTFDSLGVFQISPGSIIDNDISSSAAISRSKINLGNANRLIINDPTGVLNDADAISANRVLVSNANGIPIASAISDTTLTYLDANSSIQTQLDNRLEVTLTSPATGDMVYYNGTAWVNIPKGSDGQVLTSDASSIGWDDATANGLPTAGTQYQLLRKATNTNFDTEWHTLITSDITDLTVEFSELNLLDGLTVGATQINYLATVNEDVQVQLDRKMSSVLTYHSIWIGGPGDTAQQVGVGSEGSVLKVVSGHPTWQLPPAPGTFSGPVSSTDNAIVRFNGTTGNAGQDSGVIIDDSNNITGVANLSSGQISILNQAALRLYETGSVNYVAIRSAGAMSADYTITLPAAAPGSNTYLKYDGTNYTWATVSGGGGTATQQKDEPGSSYLVTDADDGYIIYMTNVTGATVTLSTSVSSNISVTIVRSGGLVTHAISGSGGSLETIGTDYDIEQVNGAVTWVKNGSLKWQGWGSLGPASSGGGSGTVTSVTGTTNRISIGGTSTDPVIDISTSYVGQASITTLGTIATGTWSATSIGITKGGTGLSAAGTSGQLIRVNSGATAFEYFTPSYISGNQTITLSGVVSGSGTTTITTTIAAGQITSAMLRDSAATSVIGNSTNASGVPGDISTSTSGHVLRRSGTTLAFGTIGNASIDDLAWSKITGAPTTLAGYGITDATSKEIAFSPQTGSYTLVLADAGKCVEINSASSSNLTIPPNSSVAFPVGTQLLIAQYGAGQITILGGSGVTIRTSNSANKISAQYGVATAFQRATNEWYISGDLIP